MPALVVERQGWAGRAVLQELDSMEGGATKYSVLVHGSFAACRDMVKVARGCMPKKKCYTYTFVWQM